MTHETIQLPINELVLNPNNPRSITDDKFSKLVDSLKEFPDMALVRPIVVNTEKVVLGGNMRLRAMLEAGWTEAPVVMVDWPEEKQREFLIKDNVGFGEWDWQLLNTEWDVEELERWGLDIEDEKDEKGENLYTRKVESPVYEITGEKPSVEELVESDYANRLIAEIEAEPDLPADVRVFLLRAAERHRRFNFERIAEFYAHADARVQRLMENSALVIIDFDRAIELGFVKMVDEISEAFSTDHNGGES